MKKDHRESTVGPWSADKLAALEAYLAFYNTALKNQPFERVYIDAFAGAPRSKVRGSDVPPEPTPFLDEEEALEARTEFITGSPVRALGLYPGFHRHHFFDLDGAAPISLESYVLAGMTSASRSATATQ